jgi:hypothetical protein
LPALREHLADYLTTFPAHLSVADALRRGRGTLRPITSPEVGADLLLSDERQRLNGAQLFYVTSDITRLVRQAAPSLRDDWDSNSANAGEVRDTSASTFRCPEPAASPTSSTRRLAETVASMR